MNHRSRPRHHQKLRGPAGFSSPPPPAWPENPNLLREILAALSLHESPLVDPHRGQFARPTERYQQGYLVQWVDSFSLPCDDVEPDHLLIALRQTADTDHDRELFCQFITEQGRVNLVFWEYRCCELCLLLRLASGLISNQALDCRTGQPITLPAPPPFR